jgi:hypothetical protein
MKTLPGSEPTDLNRRVRLWHRLSVPGVTTLIYWRLLGRMSLRAHLHPGVLGSTFLNFVLCAQMTLLSQQEWHSDSYRGPWVGRSQFSLTMVCAQNLWPLAQNEKIIQICQNKVLSVSLASSQRGPTRVLFPPAWYAVLGVLSHLNFSISRREIAKQHSFM